MTLCEIVRPIPATFWELRGCWATGRRVTLLLDADVRRAEGHVTKVAATDAFVCLGDLLVPAERILAVHLPSRLGDSTYVEGAGPWHGSPRKPVTYPGQLDLEV